MSPQREDTPSRRLADKVAIVTGASRGIGRAVAERFAAEGARLVLNCLQDQAALDEVRSACESAGAEVETVVGDVAEGDTAQILMEAAVNRFGRIDILVNNAAVALDDLLAMQTDEAIDRMVRTNVVGVVRLTRAVTRPMMQRRSGVIINLSSVAASKPARGNAVYAGTKGFVESFTRALAVELGRKGIRVNAVAPGVIETNMSASVVAVAHETIRERIAMRRLGSAGEVASMVAALASDEAGYVNGAVIPIDGGFLGGV
jgi:3-oxoacyl-[acyl-carrier protein] reductase